MTPPTTFALGPDLVARLDRNRYPMRIVLERGGKPVTSMTYDLWCRTHGDLQRAVREGATGRSKP